jgi:tRNA A-37 threonylcarbamoyl transferase component Bud32
MDASLQKHIQDEANIYKKGWEIVKKSGILPERVNSRSEVFLVRLDSNGNKILAYLKIYSYRKHSLQRIFRIGRSIREARNTLFFRHLGISTPELLAWGDHRNWIGRITQEFIITRAIEKTISLEQFYRTHRANHLERLRVALKLGKWLRQIHKTSFRHKDIHWRNILVERTDHSAIKLHLIDLPTRDVSSNPTGSPALAIQRLRHYG